MENSWQMKCGSSTQSMASSTSQEPRKMGMDSGYCFYPHVSRELRSTVKEKMQDSLLPKVRNISSCRQVPAELGNSFLALLSAPQSLLQCDFQEQSNLKSSNGSSSKLPLDGTGGTVASVRSGVLPIASGGQFECHSNQNLPNGENLHPILSSRGLANSNCSINSALHGGLESVNLSLRSSDLSKAVIHQLLPSNEREKDFAYAKWKQNATSLAHTVKLPSSCIPRSQKVPLQESSSFPSLPSTCTSKCPRVICLGASGDLLLSNTGLLGVVCSCHHFHMSVAKFCEHIGLREVNPGDAVHMESGETIAQWRKLYFLKFGIRVPDDQHGWDWPEALSATAGLVKSSVALSNLTNNSDLSKLVGSSGGLINSGQPLDNILVPKNTRADENVVIGALHDKEQTYGQNNSNCLLKGFINTSKSNTPAGADNQIMECSLSRCSTSLKFVDGGSDGGSQSLSAYIDSYLKSGNSSITIPASQNSRIRRENYDFRKIENACDVVIPDRVATSSNIELRLGQPYQQSHLSGNSVPSVTGPRLLDVLVGPSKSLLLEQMTNNVTSCGEKVTSRQYSQCAAGTTNLFARRELNQLNLGNHEYGISHATDAAKLEKFDGNITKNSVVPLLTHFNTPPERNANSQVNNKLVTGDYIMPKSVCCESYTAKSNQVGVPLSVINGMEKQMNVSELGFFRLKDKGDGTGFIENGSYATTDSELNFQKHLEGRSTFPVPVSGSIDPSSSAVHEGSYYSHQSSGMPPDAFDARNLINHPEKVPCLGDSRHSDHLFLTTKPRGSAQLLQSHAVPMAYPLDTSTSLQGMGSAVSKLEGIGLSPYLLDDNMRLLALRQILELSKQQHSISSLEMDQEKGRSCSLSNVNIQHQFVEPSAFAEQILGHNINSQQNSFEGAMLSTPSGAYTRLGVNIENSGPVTDLNNSCNFSTWTQGNPLFSREMDLQCQFSCDPPSNKQPSLRSEHISSSIENTKCYQRVPNTYLQSHCSCAAYAKCLSGNCESRIGSCPNTFKEQVANANDETSMLVGSEFVEDETGPKEKTISIDQRPKEKGQVAKNSVGHASQWRDVPSKFKGVTNLTCLDQSAELLDGRGQREGQLRDTISGCSYGTMKIHDSLKEQEMSNISSGCSADVVTHASVLVNNVDSSTINVGNTEYVNNHVVDEGSGIDKCWSSDDALESERSAEFPGSNCKTNLRKRGYSKMLNNQPSRSLLDELRILNSLTWKRSTNQTPSRLPVHGKINLKKIEEGFKTGKRKKAMKVKMLESPFPIVGPPTVHCEHPRGAVSFEPCSSKDVELFHPPFPGTYDSGACSLRSSAKPRRFTSCSSKELSRKRDLHMIYGDHDWCGDCQMESNGNSDPCKIHEFSGIKKLCRACTLNCAGKSQIEEPTNAHPKNTVRCRSFGCVKASCSDRVNICYTKPRPVVCGKYGEISSGELIGDVPRPAKIVSLSTILKTSRRCTLPKNVESKLLILPGELKKSHFCGSDFGRDGFNNLRKIEERGFNHSAICDMNIDTTVEEDEKICTKDKLFADDKSMLEKGANKGKKNFSTLKSNVLTKLNPKNKEIQKRSLCELTEKGRKSRFESFSLMKSSECMPKMKEGKVLRSAEGDKHHVWEFCRLNSDNLNHRHRSFSTMDLDAFCCVCGGSINDEINCLLECNRCFIKVHQACYGISKVPKGPWYCRPCRTSSRDIVCVLCGYGGGAMTRALRSRTIVKSLLKAWNIEAQSTYKNAVSSDKIMEGDLNILHSSGSRLEGKAFPVLQPVNVESPTATVWKLHLQNQLNIVQKSSFSASNLGLHNSITAGILDSTVKQWIHMVCGLWTPATRCPNVDTMSAFDVSGVSCPKANVVCSMCNRPGGSCIKCRVVNCSVRFHPWCAHQKGLLQSEVEGAENESVGFYGRCMCHATHPLCESGSDPIDIEVDFSGQQESTCARTEGYKGRKRDGFWHNLYGQSRGKSGCLVPQEQLNAWIHINGQKSSTRALLNLPVRDIEYDCRKEYVRYKQAEGWKHLVVYKSGIHALGLYTSRFISRGEMVVEYVGEIVGLRVADKRENEYQSGRKLQYKSACYFFRIDKEHIIDATCKGGIARFVNHSCLPNCVAKVISVRNEKKVIFLAERDIYPGEEITYDYHFNHEDEGKKIPCFCNSKNCRRYLN